MIEPAKQPKEPPGDSAHVPYWSAAELEEVRRFIELTPAQKLNLLLDALHFLHSAKQPAHSQLAPDDSSTNSEESRL